MGASFAKHSNLPSSPSSSDSSSLEDIPENCISIVFMYLDPPEICNLASLNRAFRAASSADFVWESKLPPNYNFLLHRVLHPQLCQPKKHIFATLTRPYLFDHATKVIIIIIISCLMDIQTSHFLLNIIQTIESFLFLGSFRRFGWIKVLEKFLFLFHPRL